MRFSAGLCCSSCLHVAAGLARAADGNRLAYLDESDPFYVSRSFPKLVTPQWVGEEGVEAVVILAIDDMRRTSRASTKSGRRSCGRSSSG